MPKWASCAIAAVTLTCAALSVHGPSVMAAPRFDATMYFVERAEWPSFSQALDRLDYALSRRYWKGDEAEYRPLSFLWLAGQYHAFGVDFRYWHAALLLAHAMVGWLLYRLLRDTQTNAVALSLSGLFVVLAAGDDIISDPFVGGYLIGCALFLMALRGMWAQLDRSEPGVRREWLWALPMTLAGFFFEAMAVLSLALAPLFLFEARRSGRLNVRLALAAIMPFAVFGSVYLVRMPAAPRFAFVADVPASNLMSAGNIAALPARSLLLVARMAARAALPALRPSVAVARRSFTRALWNLAGGLNVVLLLAGLAVVWRGRWLLRHEDRHRAAAVLLSMLAYGAFIRFGRGVEDSSHLYIFGLLSVLLLGALVKTSEGTGPIRWQAKGVVAALIALNAAISVNYGVREWRAGSEFVRYLAAVDRFARANQNGRQLSFAVQPSPVASGREVTLVEGYPDMPRRSSTLSPAEAIFGAERQVEAADVVLRWNGSSIIVEKTRVLD